MDHPATVNCVANILPANPRRRPEKRLLGAASTVMGLVALAMGPASADAQSPSARQVAALLDQDPVAIRRALLAAGPAQVKAQLTAAGLSPEVLDGFLSGQPLDEVVMNGDVLRALAALETVEPTPDGVAALPVTTGVVQRLEDDPTPSRVFGIDVFRRASTRFQPLLSGPVPDEYQLGPGDRLVLILTGEVELAHELPVTRGGFIVVPDVGRVSVANLTLAAVRQILEQRLARSYSGIERGTTFLDITISELGVNQVYVAGEVEQPGAYQLSSVATVLNALYAAGGPSELGNLRAIKVRRRSGEEHILDLYPYLLDGDVTNDVTLEQGDVVFVPLHGRRVTLAGALPRPAIYELAADDDLDDVLTAAGGFGAQARRERITIHRVVHPSADDEATTRVAIDVALPPAREDTGPGVVGGVRIPPVGLVDGDSVVVDALPPVDRGAYVTIAGLVEAPGRFPWREGLTVRDLVLLARGPTVGADLRHAEVSRLPADRTEGQLATLIRVPLDSSYVYGAGSGGGGGGAPGQPFPAAGTASEFELQPYDRIEILRQPDFEMQRTVTISGEVPVPGRYTLETKDDRVTDLLSRAGGLLSTAYVPGARLIRSRDELGSINLDLTTALDRPDGREDLILEPGDSLHIPVYSPTVTVRGAVNSPLTVLYEEGRDVKYYLENAGGLRHDADEDRLSVRFANGQAETRSKFLFWSGDPEPRPGSTITVPERDPDDRTDVRGIVTDVVSILGTVTTLAVVLTR